MEKDIKVDDVKVEIVKQFNNKNLENIIDIVNRNINSTIKNELESDKTLTGIKKVLNLALNSLRKDADSNQIPLRKGNDVYSFIKKIFEFSFLKRGYKLVKKKC